MKITTLPGPTGFKPIHFQIEVESQAELDALVTVFNSAALHDALQEACGVIFPFGTVFARAGGEPRTFQLAEALSKHYRRSV